MSYEPSPPVERTAYCLMCRHSAPRHKDAHHRKARFRLVCLICAVAVTERGIPLSLYAERYPCGYGGKAPDGGWLPLSFERKEVPL